MSTTVTRTPDQMAAEAAAILREVVEAPWPESRDAQHAIGWAYDRAAECGGYWSRLLNGDEDPLSAPAPDRGWWSDPLPAALEWAADEYLEAAKTARNRLAEWQRKGEKS
jgi:hypothetical protein